MNTSSYKASARFLDFQNLARGLRAGGIGRVCASAYMAISLGLIATACSQQQLVKFATGEKPYHQNYWVISADTSGSTTRQTQVGGPYEQEAMAALEEAAHEEATLYAAPIDGNSLADADWSINALSLHDSGGGGSARIAEAVDLQRARGLRGQIRTLLHTRLTNGSDIMGALARISQLGRDLPRDAPKTLVLLTDGAINLSLSGGYDIYTDPPDTPGARRALVALLKRRGELPSLPNWTVYAGGIGVGVGNRATAQAIIALWEELVPAMGARLVQMNSTLAFPHASTTAGA